MTVKMDLHRVVAAHKTL